MRDFIIYTFAQPKQDPIPQISSHLLFSFIHNCFYGFIVEGTGKFIDNGLEFDAMKNKFSFLTRVLEITVSSAKQIL
jgi:hypothetical protein